MKSDNLINNLDLVSVIVPLYNKELWVARCIQSIISQTYQNIEIIIVNDGSTDSSYALVSLINDPRIKIFDKDNGGVSSARNLGIEKSKGEYIAFIDADDEWELMHLEVMLEGFQQFDDIVLVCDNLVEISDGEKEYIIRRKLPFNLSKIDKNKVHYFVIEDYVKTLKDNYFLLSGSSVLIKSSVIKENQLKFYEQLTHGEDINYWLKLSQFGKFVFCDYLGLSYHRVDDKSAMSQKMQIAQLIPDYFYGIDMKNYSKKDKDNIKKFLSREYYKKAYQNRGLPLRSDEFATCVSGVQIGRINILIYLGIRYCPRFIFSLYKKIKS